MIERKGERRALMGDMILLKDEGQDEDQDWSDEIGETERDMQTLQQ